MTDTGFYCNAIDKKYLRKHQLVVNLFCGRNEAHVPMKLLNRILRIKLEAVAAEM